MEVARQVMVVIAGEMLMNVSEIAKINKRTKKKGGMIIMQTENVSELIFLSNDTFYMDCSSEGSMDPQCDCDGVDGS